MNPKLFLSAVAILATSQAYATTEPYFPCKNLVSAAVIAVEGFDGNGVYDDDSDRSLGLTVSPKDYSKVKAIDSQQISDDGGWKSTHDVTVAGERLTGKVRVMIGRHGVCRIQHLSLK